MAMFLVKTIKQVKKLMIAVIGFTVLAIGVVLIVLPGPAILVIPAGLAILSIEFAWARNLLKRMKEKLGKRKSTDPAPDTNSK
jgi:tellurite resistance protein TerC